MTLKWIGASLVVLGCGGFGFIIASALKRECFVLRQLIAALDYMMNELHYRMTPLPELFRLTSSVCKGTLCNFLLNAAKEMDRHTTVNAKQCISATLKMHPDIPKKSECCLNFLGQSIGTFDLSGQLKALESVKMEAERLLLLADEEQANKQKYYKTLGISAGIALVILFI